MFFYINLKKIRKKWGLNQEEFSDLIVEDEKYEIECNRGKISSYEIDAAAPRILFFLRLQDLSGIPIYDICDRMLDDSEISEKPYSTAPVFSTKKMETDSVDLYYTPNMVSAIEDVQKRLEALEAKVK